MRSFHLRQFRRPAGLAVLLTAVLGPALPVFADPPPQAPAHGWRKKHDPYYVGYTGRHWDNDHGIVEGRCNRAAIGTVLGGAVGAAVGSRVAEGSDRNVAIVLGAVIGAVIGHEIGRDMDESDRGCVGHALELAKDGQRIRWTNEKNGVTYVLKPVAQAEKGTCRTFELMATLAGKSQTEKGKACRTGDGTWRMSS